MFDIFAEMESLGYAPYHTGGSCMVWNKDIAPGRCFWICTDSQELNGDPNAKIWLAGSYANCGENWVNHTGLTLAEAVAILPTLPIPTEPGE